MLAGGARPARESSECPAWKTHDSVCGWALASTHTIQEWKLRENSGGQRKGVFAVGWKKRRGPLAEKSSTRCTASSKKPPDLEFKGL